VVKCRVYIIEQNIPGSYLLQAYGSLKLKTKMYNYKLQQGLCRRQTDAKTVMGNILDRMIRGGYT
jgi:hypothetical protein